MRAPIFSYNFDVIISKLRVAGFPPRPATLLSCSVRVKALFSLRWRGAAWNLHDGRKNCRRLIWFTAEQQFNNKSELPNKLFIITTTRDVFLGPGERVYIVYEVYGESERQGDIKKQEKHFITCPKSLLLFYPEREIQIYIRARRKCVCIYLLH